MSYLVVAFSLHSFCISYFLIGNLLCVTDHWKSTWRFVNWIRFWFAEHPEGWHVHFASKCITAAWRNDSCFPKSYGCNAVSYFCFTFSRTGMLVCLELSFKNINLLMFFQLYSNLILCVRDECSQDQSFGLLNIISFD